MTDTVENSLWCSMRRDGLEADLFHLRTLLLSDFAPRYHPLEEFLEKAGPWDGVTDHIGNLAAMVHPADSDTDRFDLCFRRWFVGMVAAALDPKVVNHVILVLIGRQGCFKTSFFQNLLPPRPQTLLRLQDQLATAHEGRPLHHDGELARQFRGDRLHAAQ